MTNSKPTPDKRAYSKLDNCYLDNPKVLPLLEDSPRAVLLHLSAIVYCSRNLTDGVFNARKVAADACATLCGTHCDGHCEPLCDLAKLMHCGLVELNSDGTYEVHDYLLHNRSSTEVTGKSEAGRRAARVRWAQEAEARRNAERIADGNAERIAERNAERERKRTTSPHSPNDENETDSEDTSTREQAREKKATKDERQDVEHLCALLAELVEGNGSKRPTITERWRTSARLLIDTDQRDPDDIERVMRWALADPFWASNILSMPKLRAKFDQLRLKAGQTTAAGRRAQTEDEEARKSWTPHVERTPAEMDAIEAASLERIAARNTASQAEQEARTQRANGIADLKAANLWPRNDDGTWNNNFTPEQIDDLILNTPKKAPAAVA